MADVTGGKAKELLPLGGKTVLDFVVQEAFEAGAEQVVIVGSEVKPELDEWVAGKQSDRIVMRYQERPLGLANAVASAGVDGPILVLLGDTILNPYSPSLRLWEASRMGEFSAVAVQEVPEDRVSRYGIVEAGEDGLASRILEKPGPGVTESRWAISARYIIGAEASKLLHDEFLDPEPGPELSLSHVFQRGLEIGQNLVPVELRAEEMRLDCGSAEGYEAAKKRLGS
jgi:UTP--glucose-1-phosphate uridylyltransferase